MINHTEIAEKFKNECQHLNWKWRVDSKYTTITIYKYFKPGDRDEFVSCDMEYNQILAIIPRTSPGSIWGTDGGGVGALSAIKSGLFTEHKSGCSKRVLAALRKMNND